MVLVIYIGFRVVCELLSAIALLLSLVQLHRDRRKGIWSKDDWVTHNVFRKVAIVASVIEICANVDFLGVFGIYPTEARIFFKTINLTVLSSAMLTYVYYTAKSCFPFVFISKLQTATKRLKAAIFAFHFVGNMCYCLNAIFSNRVALIVINFTFLTILSSTIVASLVFLQRIRNLLSKSPAGAKKKNLQRQMNQWRKFTILFSIAIFVVVVQSLSELIAVIQNDGGQPLLPIDQKNFVDPNALSVFGTSEMSLIVAGIASIYLFIWRAWLSKNGESRVVSRGSTQSDTGASASSVGVKSQPPHAMSGTSSSRSSIQSVWKKTLSSARPSKTDSVRVHIDACAFTSTYANPRAGAGDMPHGTHLPQPGVSVAVNIEESPRHVRSNAGTFPSISHDSPP